MIQSLTTELRDRQMVIILEGLNFDWREWELDDAVSLWQAGVPFEAMVDRLRPHTLENYHQTSYSDRADEVGLLLMHLGREGRIDRRDGGVLR